MEIKLHEIKVKDLYDGYIDEGENGVFAFDDKLSVRPPYQRECDKDHVSSIEEYMAIHQNIVRIAEQLWGELS